MYKFLPFAADSSDNISISLTFFGYYLHYLYNFNHNHVNPSAWSVTEIFFLIISLREDISLELTDI